MGKARLERVIEARERAGVNGRAIGSVLTSQDHRQVNVKSMLGACKNLGVDDGFSL